LHLIDAMPRGEKFSAAHFIDKILTPTFAQLIPTGRRQLIIHADNSRCHNAKVVVDFMSRKQTKFAAHPPYSPDLTPSAFFLLGYLKGGPRGSFFQTSDELLNAVRELLHDISPQMLLDVFHKWINRCEQIIATKGTTLNK
jgi:hypothetical protein